MKRIGQALSILVVAMLVLAAAMPAYAYIYSGKRRRINCGIVLLNNGEDRGSLDCNGLPYRMGTNSLGQSVVMRDYAYSLFTILEMRVDLKPLGWSLQNPHSPGGMYTGTTTRIEDRPENRPEYWFVNLHTYKDLTDMQVLYLPAAGDVALSDEDREKLRRFVDAGGVLWIDNCGSTGNPLNFGTATGDPYSSGTFFIPYFYFKPSGGGTDVAVSRHHPILTLPFWISEAEIGALGANPGQFYCIPGYDAGSTGGWGSRTTAPLTFDILYPITNNTTTGKASIAANAYGSGRIVATSNAVGRGCLLNYPLSLPSLKFAYNTLAWSASWTHLRKDPRHSGHSIDTVGGTKLVESWKFLAPPTARVASAPIIYKNVVFYSSGAQLYALDLVPDEDLDQDGNPDDGAAGTGGGPDTGQDIIWAWQGDGGTLSSPTMITAQDPSDPGASIEAVLVMSASGKAYMIEAFPNNAGILLGTAVPILTWDTEAGSISEPYPPLYVNGWLYAVGGDGRLHAYNPSLENWAGEHTGSMVHDRWSVPNQPGNTITCTPKAGPAFGWVTNESNGALIGMIYWAGSGWPNNLNYANDWIYGAPAFVANDVLKMRRTNSARTLVECMIALPRVAVAASPQPIVRVTRSDGSEIDATIHVNRKLYPANVEAIYEAEALGWITLETTSPIPTDARIVAEYAIDYGNITNPISQAPVQKWLEPSSASNLQGAPPGTTLVGTPALGAKSMIYACGSRNADNGGASVYGMKNDGITHSCKWNFEVHHGINSPTAVPPVVFTSAGDGTILPMDQPRVFGSPVVAGSKVFVAVNGRSDTFDKAKPTAAILCLKANPEFTVRITEKSGSASGDRRAKALYDSTGRELSIRLWQPDILSTSANTIPPPVGATTITKNLNMVDYAKGTITFESFDRPKIRGLGSTEANTFTPSLPVWVYVENTEIPIDWSTWGPAVRAASITGQTIEKPSGDAVDLSQWNNLLWYYVVPPHDDQVCTGIHSSPVVIGNACYFMCDDGYLFAIPTEADETSGGQVEAPDGAWSEQVCGGLGEPNTSIAGSNGVMLVPGSDGLYAYMNATTLVADSGRVLEVDGSGEASWSVDTITWPAAIPPTASTYASRMSGPVNKPARAKYGGSGEVIVVNTGANQVCKIDRSGVVGLDAAPNANTGAMAQYVRWVWDKFTDPKQLLRPGQPTELRGPTDALYWREWENGNLVIHCLIADSGNHRVIDLVYRIGYDSKRNPTGLVLTDPTQGKDPATGFYLPELNWVSVTDSMNEQYVYECIQLVQNQDVSAGQYIWAAVSNYRTGTNWDEVGAEPGKGLGGAIVALKYRVPVAGGWNYGSSPADRSGEIVAACDRASWGGKVRPLAEPKFFQVMDRAATSGRSAGRYIIVCDNYGVYEIGPLSSGSAVPPLVRAIEDMTYRNMERTVTRECDGGVSAIPSLNGVPLQARSVQELNNGNWLITNDYSGADPSGTRQFRGEVFELSWMWNNWTQINEIAWNAPTITCDCDLNLVDKPTLPDTWRQGSKNTYMFQQPASALRQF